MKTFLAALLCLVSVSLNAQRIDALPEIFDIETNDLFLIYTPSVGGYKATLTTVASNIQPYITVSASTTNGIIGGSNLGATNTTNFGVYNTVTSMTNMNFWTLRQGSNVVMYREGGTSIVINASAAGSSSASANTAVGKTLFLDSVFGNDSTATRTNLGSPYATPSNAVTAMLTGDTFVIRGGPYVLNSRQVAGSNPTAALGFTNLSNIKIIAEPSSVFYMGGLKSNNLSYACPGMWFQNCTNVIVEGLTMIGIRTNAAAQTHAAIVLNGCDGVLVRKCSFSNWQNHAIVAMSDSTVNRNLTFEDNMFSNCGGTNHVTLGGDGAAVNVEATNFIAHANRFFYNFRDVEFCCNADSRQILISDNLMVGTYGQSILLISTNSSDVKIADNVAVGYATNAVGFGAAWLNVWAGSNVTVQGNQVAGFGTAIDHTGATGYRTVDWDIFDNRFQDVGYTGINMQVPIGNTHVMDRIRIMRNYFRYCTNQAISFNGHNSIVADNTLVNCNLDSGVGGYMRIGFTGYATNNTNTTITGNRFIGASTQPAINIDTGSSSNVVWGNEIDRRIVGGGGGITNNGSSLLGQPMNLIGKGKMVYSDTNSRLAEVTIGSGMAFNGSSGTLSSTASGGGAGAAIQFLANDTSAITGTNLFLYTNEAVKLMSSGDGSTLILNSKQIIQGHADYGISMGVPAVTNFHIRNALGNVGIGTPLPHISASLDVTGAVYSAEMVASNSMSVGASSGLAGKMLLYDSAGLVSAIIAPTITRAVTNYAHGDTNHGVWVSQRIAAGQNITTNLFGAQNQILSWSGSTALWKDLNAYSPVLMTAHAISGSEATNYTLFAPTNEMIIGVATNLSINASMIYDPAVVHYWTLSITNITGNNQTVAWRQETNSWRWSGAYGTNSPSVLTNNTRFHAAARQQGTNIQVGYTYFQWP